jgi:fructose-specific component phosphotransferase system IIB-like protein
VNIQRDKDGNAKAYQVRQVLDAIARLAADKNETNEEGDDDA